MLSLSLVPCSGCPIVQYDCFSFLYFFIYTFLKSCRWFVDDIITFFKMLNIISDSYYCSLGIYQVTCTADYTFSAFQLLTFIKFWMNSVLYSSEQGQMPRFALKIIIMFISSNYLFVSGEHRAHYNINVCSRFCCTTHPFQAFGYPSLLPYMGGSVFILVIRRGVCANAAVYFKAISPMMLSHWFFVSLHIHDTTYSARISPCPLCSLLWISGLRHSTEIDLCL